MCLETRNEKYLIGQKKVDQKQGGVNFKSANDFSHLH